MITSKDERLMRKKGISPALISSQINQFERGCEPVNLQKTATVGEGIQLLNDVDEKKFTDIYDKYEGTVSKFVPASGAASRMFKELFEFRASYKHTTEGYERLSFERGNVHDFFENLEKFAFYEDLKIAFEKQSKISISEARRKKEYLDILETLLARPGLNYGNLPKGLLKFHTYLSSTRTPVQEHIDEGRSYASKEGKLYLHFTLSLEQVPLFQLHIDEILEGDSGECAINISFSIQKSSTDTISVNEFNEPFRTEKGELLFRPAGHGALLENLNEQDSNLVFIKNIDNVVPSRLKAETIRHKKILAGLLVYYQGKVFDLLRKHAGGENVCEKGKKLLDELGIRGDFSDDMIISKLNRPIRVCGMVKNGGGTGGGPFWTVDKNGNSTLQIVEDSQIDKSNMIQSKIFNESTHFNPVDLVCAVKNFAGKKFDLPKYRDPNSGFISEKTYNGKKLKALEFPGLWNGSMADWNTVFVEVPLITFNPVKTVNDLLKKEHQN